MACDLQRFRKNDDHVTDELLAIDLAWNNIRTTEAPLQMRLPCLKF